MSHYKKPPFSKSRKHSQYTLSNWPDYNNYLRNRGRIDFMIAEDLSQDWYDNTPSSKRGGQIKYSDRCIEICLQIRCLFNLRLRQTQGFIDFLFKACGFPFRCPDYTTLSKRADKLQIQLTRKKKYYDHISIDSTGIQTFTGNEWLENKHGKRYGSVAFVELWSLWWIIFNKHA